MNLFNRDRQLSPVSETVSGKETENRPLSPELLKTEEECFAPAADPARTRDELRRQPVCVRSGKSRNFRDLTVSSSVFLFYLHRHFPDRFFYASPTGTNGVI